MEKPVVGEVVAIAFPFSDLSGSKLRPALVLAALPGNDLILCQITSRFRADRLSLPIEAGSFEEGALPVASLVRCGKIFTADARIIQKRLGLLKTSAMNQIVTTVVSLLGKNL